MVCGCVLCAQHSWGLMVCLSLLGNSGTMVSNGWGVLPRFSRVKPVLLGCESDQTSLFTFVVNPSTGTRPGGRGASGTGDIETVKRFTASASESKRWKLSLDEPQQQH